MSDEKYSALLKLLKQIRQAKKVSSLHNMICNHTKDIVNYTQAILFVCTADGAFTTETVSGISHFNKEAPYIQWITNVVTFIFAQKHKAPVYRLDMQSLPKALQRRFADYQQGYYVWCDLISPTGNPLGGLCLARAQPWEEDELSVLEALGGTYSHAWIACITKQETKLKSKRRFKRKFLLLSFLSFLLASAFIPISQTALASAEIIPKDPTVITAKTDGVIKELNVSTNQMVQAGQSLFVLDDLETKKQLQLQKIALSHLAEQMKQTSKHAFFHKDGELEQAILQRQVQKKSLEIKYLQDKLNRHSHIAPTSGIILMHNPDNLVGKTVQTGERVMLLATPDQKTLLLRLPIAKAIDLQQDGQVRFFMDADPLTPIAAKIDYISYSATTDKQNHLSYLIKARFLSSDVPRIGAHGTAKLYGNRVSLFYFLFHKPLAQLRRIFGF